MVVRWTPTASAISATVCCRFPSGPVAWYMRRTVTACRALQLGLAAAGAAAGPGGVQAQSPVRAYCYSPLTRLNAIACT